MKARTVIYLNNNTAIFGMPDWCTEDQYKEACDNIADKMNDTILSSITLGAAPSFYIVPKASILYVRVELAEEFTDSEN